MLRRSNDVLSGREEIQYRNPTPDSKTQAGIYIDDFGVLAAVDPSKEDPTHTEPRDKEIMRKADDTYAKVGVPIKASKKLSDLPEGKLWVRTSLHRLQVLGRILLSC
eukprot:6815968-Heterocapsa_arctica.AAC.1